MTCGDVTYSKLPAILPFRLGDTDYLYTAELKKARHSPFRRVYFKRRLLTGEYESTWQEITSDKILKYGVVKIAIDSNKINFFEQSGVTLHLWNGDGYFEEETIGQSFWFGYLGQQYTLIKIEAGYTHCETGEELPFNETGIFYGIYDDEVQDNFDGTVNMTFQPLTKVFQNAELSDVDFSGVTTYTAGNIIAAIKNHQDSGGNYYFQKFISTWNIASNTTFTYDNIATASYVSGSTVWDAITGMAEAEGYIVYIGGDGAFNFASRSSTADVQFHFYGGTINKYGNPNIIININSYKPAKNKVYNKIRMKYLKADTSTSYVEATEVLNWLQTSSSNTFGQKKYEFTNLFVPTTATAQSIVDNLYAEYSELKREIQFETVYHPQVQILDLTRITFSNKYEDTSAIWGKATWGTTIWEGSVDASFSFYGDYFKIISVEHDIDDFSSKFTGELV